MKLPSRRLYVHGSGKKSLKKKFYLQNFKNIDFIKIKKQIFPTGDNPCRWFMYTFDSDFLSWDTRDTVTGLGAGECSRSLRAAVNFLRRRSISDRPLDTETWTVHMLEFWNVNGLYVEILQRERFICWNFETWTVNFSEFRNVNVWRIFEMMYSHNISLKLRQ